MLYFASLTHPSDGEVQRGRLASLKSGTLRRHSLCSSYTQLSAHLPTLHNRQQLPPEASLRRGSLGSPRGDRARGPGGEELIDLWKGRGLQTYPYRPRFPQFTCDPLQKVTLVTPRLKESLVSNFGRYIYAPRGVEIQGVGRQYGIFLRSTVVWIFECLSPKDFKIICLCWFLNSCKTSRWHI